MPEQHRELDFLVRYLLADYDEAAMHWRKDGMPPHERWLLRKSVRDLLGAKSSDGSVNEALLRGAASFIELFHRRRSNVPSDHADLPQVRETEVATHYQLEDFESDTRAATAAFAHIHE